MLAELLVQPASTVPARRTFPQPAVQPDINAARNIRLIASGLLGFGSGCCAIPASSAASSSRRAQTSG